jgi:hypothetical protein
MGRGVNGAHINPVVVAGLAKGRYDPIYSFLNRAAAAADWGLPEDGPVADLLNLDCSDWGPPRYCPVTDVLRSAKSGGDAPWHGNVRSPWDPLIAILSVKVTSNDGRRPNQKSVINTA